MGDRYDDAAEFLRLRKAALSDNLSRLELLGGPRGSVNNQSMHLQALA